MIVPKSTIDQIIDGIVDALKNFSIAQVAESGDNSNGFYVIRDLIRPANKSKLPLVNIWLDGVEPVREASTRHFVNSEIAKINVDCYARGICDDDTDSIPDGVAMQRLYYLAEQVKYAIYNLISNDFGLEPGVIARKNWPRYTLFQNELRLPETEIVAGRWAIDIQYQWSPMEIERNVLDRITVDTGQWSVYYDYS